MKPADYVLTAPVRLDKALGYQYFLDHQHPLASKQGKVYFHRHIASIVIGRWVQDDEDVHHRNGIKDDNTPSNLEVLLRSDHARLHLARRAPGRIKLLRPCEECCNPTHNKRFCCLSCSYQATRRTERPDAATLQAEIDSTSWLELGRKYGVSDNAVRKWARGYGLI